jgi:DNA replication protein DnaD
MQKKVTLSIDDKVYEKFQKFCQENAIMLSRKLEIEMLDIMKKGGKGKNE